MVLSGNTQLDLIDIFNPESAIEFLLLILGLIPLQENFNERAVPNRFPCKPKHAIVFGSTNLAGDDFEQCKDAWCTAQ